MTQAPFHLKMENLSNGSATARSHHPLVVGCSYYHSMVPSMNVEVIDPGKRRLQGQGHEVKARWSDAMWSASQRKVSFHIP